MRWENLSGDNFTEAVTAADGVCIIPLSCLERHGPHLPLGTDMFIAREMCNRIASEEPVIIFPDVILTQILEARHCPGTVAIDTNLILRMLENICQEISRNGLKKIVLVNAHGGNTHLLHLFVQSQLASRRDYVVYLAKPKMSKEDSETIGDQWESPIDGHAGENETSQMMVIRPDLVDLSRLSGQDEGLPQGKLDSLTSAGVYTAVWWYGDHPTHYRGNACCAQASKGEAFLQARTRSLLRAIRAVKNDDAARLLQDTFFQATSFDS